MTWNRSDIVIVAGGAGIPASLRDLDVAGRTVVGVDAGALAVLDADWPLHVLVGDFDSIPPARLADVRRHAHEVVEHPADKDLTDLALALGHVTARTTDRRPTVLVCGIEGNRPDHHIASLLLCASDASVGLDLTIALDHGRAHVVREHLVVEGEPGSVVSVIPVHGPATVSIDGARWPLDRTVLAAGSTHGVSNELAADRLTLDVHDGVVLAIVPDPEDPR